MVGAEVQEGDPIAHDLGLTIDPSPDAPPLEMLKVLGRTVERLIAFTALAVPCLRGLRASLIDVRLSPARREVEEDDTGRPERPREARG